MTLIYVYKSVSIIFLYPIDLKYSTLFSYEIYE